VVRPLFEPLSKIFLSLSEDALKNMNENKKYWANPTLDPEISNLDNFKLPLALTTNHSKITKTKSYVPKRGASFNIHGGSFSKSGGSFSKSGGSFSKNSFSNQNGSFSRDQSAGGTPLPPLQQSSSFIAEDDVKYVPTPGRRRSSLLASEELRGLFNAVSNGPKSEQEDKSEDNLILVKPNARRPSLFVGDMVETPLKEEEEEEPENPWENDLSI
jgi:hypothetical protein